MSFLYWSTAFRDLRSEIEYRQATLQILLRPHNLLNHIERRMKDKLGHGTSDTFSFLFGKQKRKLEIEKDLVSQLKLEKGLVVLADNHKYDHHDQAIARRRNDAAKPKRIRNTSEIIFSAAGQKSSGNDALLS